MLTIERITEWVLTGGMGAAILWLSQVFFGVRKEGRDTKASAMDLAERATALANTWLKEAEERLAAAEAKADAAQAAAAHALDRVAILTGERETLLEDLLAAEVLVDGFFNWIDEGMPPPPPSRPARTMSAAMRLHNHHKHK